LAADIRRLVIEKFLDLVVIAISSAIFIGHGHLGAIQVTQHWGSALLIRISRHRNTNLLIAKN
jgi:hypothetical protein